MTGWIIFLVVVALYVLFVWAIIRADKKAEEAYQRWYDHPDQIWNLYKKENK